MTKKKCKLSSKKLIPQSTIISAHRSEAEILDELESICTSSGYVHSLCFIIWTENFISFNDKLTSENFSKMYSNDHILRSEISLLARLMASSKIDYTLPSPQKIQSYIDDSEKLLKELHMTLIMPWTEIAKKLLETGENISTLEIGPQSREPIFYSGESAYLFQYKAFSLDRYSNDVNWLNKNIGFSPKDAMNVYDKIHEIQLKTFKKLHDEVTLESIDSLTLISAFKFSIIQIAIETGISENIVRSIVQKFSYSNLPIKQKYRQIGAWNELSTFPIIPINSDEFLLLQSYCLAESAYESPFYWMQNDRSYRNIASDHRGQFTETFSANRLVSVFGAANVWRNITILDNRNETVGEIDVLIIYVDRAIILQAKSKRLTEAARKGNEQALKTDIEKAICDAYTQGFQCGNFLIDKKYKFKDGNGIEISFTQNYSEIFLMCVVSDYFPGLPFLIDKFIKPIDHPVIRAPYVIDIFLLDVLCELLENPLYFFSFLNRRHKYSKKIHASSEIAILAFHLGHNLWFDDGMDFINLGEDFSANIDVAMYARRDNLPAQRTPDGILTKFRNSIFGNVLDQIAKLETPGALDLGYVLLEANEETANNFSDAAMHIFSQTQITRRIHDFTIMFQDSGITVHCGFSGDDKALERLRTHCEMAKYRAKAEKWYGIFLSPYEVGKVIFAIGCQSEWIEDPVMDIAVQKLTTKPAVKSIRVALDSERQRRKISVNQPCPCGSGKKFKKCCKDKLIY